MKILWWKRVEKYAQSRAIFSKYTRTYWYETGGPDRPVDLRTPAAAHARLLGHRATQRLETGAKLLELDVSIFFIYTL